MLGILALMGVVFAGLVADLAISQATGEDPAEDAPEDEVETGEAGAGCLLDPPEADMGHITDFDAAQDEIIVLYDAEAHPDPTVTLEPIDGSQDVTVLLDGVPLAVVENGVGLDPAMIRLSAEPLAA